MIRPAHFSSARGGAARRRRRLLPVVGGVVAMAAVLSSCGSSGSADSSTQGSASAGAGSTDFAGQTLNVLFPQPHQGASETLIKDFEAKTGATVKATIVPYDEVASKLTLDAQSGTNTYDVADSFYINVGALAEDDVIEDLTGWISSTPEIKSDDFISSIYDPYSLVKGKRYGVPFDGDSHVLFYNKEILARNGISAPPQTWDEYLADVKRITANEKKNGIYGTALLGQKSPVILGSSFANRLAGFGGSFLDADGKPALNTPAAKQAAQALVDVAPYALPTPTETAFDQALPAFLNGKVAFLEFWTDLGTCSQDPKQSKIIGKWGVVPLPVGGGNTKHLASLDAGFALSITKASKHQDLAKAFVQFASSCDENLKLITTTGSGIDPIRKSSLQDPKYKTFNPLVQKAVEGALNGALSSPTVPQGPKLLQGLTDDLSGALQGQGTVDTALAKAQADWTASLGD